MERPQGEAVSESEFTVEKKEVTIAKGSFGEAIWEGQLTGNDLALLSAGISPTMIRPDALIFYVPRMDLEVDP